MRRLAGRRKLLIGILIGLVAVTVGVFVFVRAQRPPTAFPAATGGSFQSTATMTSAIRKKFPTFDAALPKKGAAEWQVPGNDGAWSLDGSGSPTFSTSLTVQDFVETDDRVLISAYDHAHVVKSVLFVLDSRTGRYLKTVVLPTTSHVGGLAYDPVADMLYVSDDTTSQAQVARIQFPAVEAYDLARQRAPIAYDSVTPVSENTTTAALGYEDDALWIADFKTSGAGAVHAYPIDRATGTLSGDPDARSASTEQLGALATTSAEIQGLAFDDDRLLVSFSYGNVPSGIALYEVGRDSGAHPTTFRYVGTFTEVPPYLEGLHVKDGIAHVLFESGASIHRSSATVPIDRILEVDLTGLTFTP